MYNGEPPFMSGSDTSEAAADYIKEFAGTQRHFVLKFFLQRGSEGATVDEVELACGLKHQSAFPRMRELEGMGQIVRLVETRRTRSGLESHLFVIISEVNERDTIPYQERRFITRDLFEILLQHLDPAKRQHIWDHDLKDE
jgi:hypothetical protein